MASPSPITRIVCIANQKGGVGKTTTAISLAAALALIKQSVLLIDCDSQGNATSGLGVSPQAIGRHLYHALLGHVAIKEVVQPTAIANLDLVPANVDLVGAEIDLVSHPLREGVLRSILAPLASYDFILLDCPPSLGLLTVNALAAAHSVLIPLQCEYFALEGLSHLIQTIRRVKHSFNPRLHIEGLLLTMYDHRVRLSSQVAREVRLHLRELVYRTTIPRNIRLGESPSHGQPIFLYDPKSKGAESYLALAREFLTRQRRPT